MRWYWSRLPGSEYFTVTNVICSICLHKRIKKSQIITTKKEKFKGTLHKEYLVQLNDLKSVRLQEKLKVRGKKPETEHLPTSSGHFVK